MHGPSKRVEAGLSAREALCRLDENGFPVLCALSASEASIVPDQSRDSASSVRCLTSARRSRTWNKNNLGLSAVVMSVSNRRASPRRLDEEGVARASERAPHLGFNSFPRAGPKLVSSRRCRDRVPAATVRQVEHLRLAAVGDGRIDASAIRRAQPARTCFFPVAGTDGRPAAGVLRGRACDRQLRRAHRPATGRGLGDAPLHSATHVRYLLAHRRAAGSRWQRRGRRRNRLAI